MKVMEFTINQITLSGDTAEVVANSIDPMVPNDNNRITFYHGLDEPLHVGQKFKMTIEFAYKLPI